MTAKKTPKPSRFKPFEELLRARLNELHSLVDQHRQEVTEENDIDDEATQAFRSSNRDLLIITMERELRNIAEIEQALARIAKCEYGVCVSCEVRIPDNRLRAIPWTRLCVDCAGGGINSRTGSREQPQGLGRPALRPSFG